MRILKPSEGRRSLFAVFAVCCAVILMMAGAGVAQAAKPRTGFTGIVTDGYGQPVEGAKVFADNGRSTPIPKYGSGVTDENGRYSLTGIPAGWYQVYVERKSDSEYDSQRKDVAGYQQAVNGQEKPLNITFDKAITVSYRLVDSKGKDFPVALKDSDGEKYTSHGVGGVGGEVWEINNRKPKAHVYTWRVQASVTALEFYIYWSVKAPHSSNGAANVKNDPTNQIFRVKIPPTSSGHVDLGKVVVHKRPKPGTITGELRTTGGRYDSWTSYLAVALHDEDNRQVNLVYLNKGNGKFKFRNVVPGNYSLVYIGLNKRQKITVKPGKATRAKKFSAKLSTISGTATGASRFRTFCVEPSSQGYGHTYRCLGGEDHRGNTFVLPNLMKGTYKVTIFSVDDMYAKPKKVRIKKAGSNATVHFKVRQEVYKRTVRGKVISGPNRPPAATIVISRKTREPREVKIAADGSFKVSKVGKLASSYVVLNAFGQTIARGKIKGGSKNVNLGAIRVK